MRRLETKALIIALAVAAQGVVAASASASTFVVDDVTDRPRGRGGPCQCVSTAGTCTLRAAVQTANLCPGPDEIELGSGQQYDLTLSGANEDAGATGDLDVSGDLEVRGHGSAIDAQWIDRVFDIHTMGSAGPAVVVFNELGMRRGRAINNNGGCVRAEQSIVHIVDGDIGECSATGGLFYPGSGNGGGVYARASDLTLTSTLVHASSATRQGGAVYADSSDLAIDGSTLTGCSAALGGGLAQRASAGAVSAITDSMFVGNHASSGGGGAYLSSAQPGVAFTGVTFRLNSTDGGGGGLLIQSTDVDVEMSTLSNNSARTGGAIDNAGANTLRVRRSTLNANTAESVGGGIHHQSGQLELASSTLADNHGAARGGAIYTRHATDLVNVTIADNTSNIAGGIFAYGSLAVVTMSNSIVARNGSAECFVWAGASFGAIHSMSGHAVCVPGPSNVVTSTPGLLALGSNGEPTQTIPLLASSPAVDGGHDPTCEPIDQRGVARPQGVHCDMGAYEREP